MRIVGAVVVGLVLLGIGPTARADEARRPRSAMCLEDCNFAFDKCRAREGSKRSGQCNNEAVRCKTKCPPEPVEDSSVPTERSHGKCIDRCRVTYKACLGRAENKRGGPCAADDMRCEQACPKPAPPPVVTAPPPASEPGGEPVVAPVPPISPPREAKPKPRAAARVEGAAAPAPASATPAAGERPGVAQPTIRSEGVAAPAIAPAAASAAARPEPAERGFFGTLRCFFRSCAPSGPPTPCLDQCSAAYDECHARESKRGGECNTRLMNCRQGCKGESSAR